MSIKVEGIVLDTLDQSYVKKNLKVVSFPTRREQNGWGSNLEFVEIDK